MLLHFALFLCFATVLVRGKPQLLPEDDDLLCGYQSCPVADPHKLNVHLIPHSHDDLGWLMTVDKYYYNQVQYVISSVVESLLVDPNRRFIQVETAYFHKWWNSQSDIMKTIVKVLINEGRLEIINGGWSMNDEATTHYQSIIDQFTLGHRWLLEQFGKCAITKTGWQIDPFGHSREQASIYSQMGFDSFFLMRYDYRDKSKRKSEKTMDLLWRGSDNLADSDIFTSTFDKDTYAWPTGYCYDMQCGDAHIVEDEDSPEYNLDTIVTDFTSVIEERAQYYPTNNIFITMGDDVHYQGAHKNFINIDRLIKGFSKYNPTINGKEINIFYSTPSCYTKAVNEYVLRENYTLNYKTDDFLPLVTSDYSGCWTGFFTSRPTSKRYERISNQVLQATKQVTALAGFPQNATFKLADAVGVMQHHDAITGTEKQDVEKDYHRKLYAGIVDSVDQLSKALSKLLGLDNNIDLHYCPLANISICEESKTDEFTVMLYNPLAREVTEYVEIPVDSGSWTVTDPEDNVVKGSLYSPIRSFQYVADDIGVNLNEKVLFFKAENLPPLGYKVYRIVRSDSVKAVVIDDNDKVDKDSSSDSQSVGYEKNYVILDGETGFVRTMSINGFEVNVTPKVMFYYSDWSSGAYMFKPNSSNTDPVSFSDKVDNQITMSNVSIEIKQEMRDWGILIIRIYEDTDYIEIGWLAGPIDVGDGQGKDVIIRYTTDLETDSYFYTDSNSRQLIERKRNFRPTFDFTSGEPQAGNYYPVTSRIVIKDESKGVEFAVITDRPQGASSLEDGDLELMVHRALLRDELEGEHLYEMEYGTGLVARGSHYITFGPITDTKAGGKSASYIQRDIAIKKHLPPVIFFPQQDIPTKSKSFLNNELPENVRLLTLEKWNDTDNTYLIRLEHILDKNDDVNLSTDVTVDVKDLFTPFSIVSLEERTLNGVTPISEVSKLSWRKVNGLKLKGNGKFESPASRYMKDIDDLEITLAPMQIRTFIATVSYNKY